MAARLSVRIVTIDFYTTLATGQGSNGIKLPVIRVFGTTEDGRKACVHVHGAVPYLYVQTPGLQFPLDSMAGTLGESIDDALNEALRLPRNTRQV